MRHENKFKIGDRVRCIDDSDTGVVKRGKEYDVVGVNDPYIDVLEDGEPHGMYAHRFELALTIEPGRHYRTRSGKPTGRVTVGDTGFEAVVDGRVRIFDKAGGAVHGDDDIVEAWVPKVGERVRRFKGRNPGSLVGHEAVVRAIEDILPYDSEGPWLLFDDDTSGYATSFEPLPVAPQPAAPTLKIEAGRYYKTRDGRKVGPLMTTDNNEYWPFKWPEQTMYYKADGYSCPGAANRHRDQDDLIAEWQETANVGAQVDTLAEEYGAAPAATTSDDNAAKPKFKVGDRVVLRNYSGSEHCYGTVEDVSVDGKFVLASDWSIGAEVGYLPVADLELADTEPDTTLHIKFTSDFSELDAAILVRKKKLKKLIKLARKAGIDLLEAA